MADRPTRYARLITRYVLQLFSFVRFPFGMACEAFPSNAAICQVPSKRRAAATSKDFPSQTAYLYQVYTCIPCTDIIFANSWSRTDVPLRIIN